MLMKHFLPILVLSVFIPPVKILIFCNFPSYLFFQLLLFRYILLLIVYVICLFGPQKMAPDEAKSTWEM